jgi:hypothetical protein
MPAHTKGREGSARDLIASAQTSSASPAAKPVKTVWRVRRAATGPERLPPAEPLASTSTQPGAFSRMADGYDLGERLLPLGRGKVGMGVEPSLCTDLGLLPPPSPSPAKGTAIKLRTLFPLPSGEGEGEGDLKTLTIQKVSGRKLNFDPLIPAFSLREKGLNLMAVPSQGERMNEISSPSHGVNEKPASGDRLANTLAPLRREAPTDARRVTLVLRRQHTTAPERAMDAEDSRGQGRAFTPQSSTQGTLGRLPRSAVAEHTSVPQTIVPIPERPRPRLSKREWAELIERLSRLIWHKLAIDLDRRGIRSWRS